MIRKKICNFFARHSNFAIDIINFWKWKESPEHCANEFLCFEAGRKVIIIAFIFFILNLKCNILYCI